MSLSMQQPRSNRWRIQLGLSSSSSNDNFDDESSIAIRYQQLCEKCSLPVHEVQQKEAPGEVIDGEQMMDVDLIDPLTAIVLEQDERQKREAELNLNYRKERAMRKRGVGSTDKGGVQEEVADEEEVWLQLIQKDLKRLSQPSALTGPEVNDIDNIEGEEETTKQKVLSRNDMLQRVLYIFACQHRTAGYLQGMHEIASYVLYALECDDGGGANTTATAEVADHDRFVMEASCFELTEAILVALLPAYDISSSIDSSNDKPLEAMSQRILAGVQQVWPQLGLQLSAAFQHIPSQLIFTKWIRLLYSRELVTTVTNDDSATSSTTHHQKPQPPSYMNRRNSSNSEAITPQQAQAVLTLWDALFQAAHEHARRYNNDNNRIPTVVSSLQRAAEAFAVARLWQNGNTILYLCGSSSISSGGAASGRTSSSSSNELLHWFMNVPEIPVDQLKTLIQRMRVVLLPLLDSDDASGSLPPPLPVSTEVLAAVQAHQQQQQQQLHAHHQHQATSPREQQHQLHSIFHSPGPILGSVVAHNPTLSSFTEKIAATTQSFQKRLSQEWEHLQQQQAAAAAQNNSSNIYNLDYYNEEPLIRGRYSNITAVGSNASGTTARGVGSSSSPPQQVFRHQTTAASSGYWAEQMQRNLSILQDFAVSVERQTGRAVDGQVWEALAELQNIQQQIQKNDERC